MDFLVGEDDETRQDAVGEDAVVILKFQGFAFEFGVFWFFFGQNARNQESRRVAMAEGEAELKFAHQLGETVVTMAGIFRGIQDAAEVGVGENAFGFDFECVVAEEGIDAFCHPVGIEDVGGLQDGVFAEVEDNAQVVQQSD